MADNQPRDPDIVDTALALGHVEGLSLTFTAELGGHTAPLKQWLALGIGSQISLDRSWKEPLNLRLNGQLVGQGHVVLVGNQFGVVVDSWGKRPDL
ncbi:FliM/FliN family flagellar motor switch protein [Sulfobacillus harzensis]|uniref:Flagellar motor switch protein FliN n=1 Tax=Sulfobacillus harzensis TaxID=2729629 RepID=A0A7Y0Q5I2_9FIRM|nr:FliM/FliN family flagellar motor switch protein [Sulfobacillus harzensis]NMP25111.1 flagellar motor switch protein FliN [Sulfobacillus harzensis]